MLTALRRVTRRLDGRPDDSGFVLITVVIVALALSLTVTALMDAALGQVPQARNDQDFHASLAAAEAGVDEYISRLNQDSEYWLNGNGDPAEPANAANSNPAFTGFVDIPGGSVNQPQFRYSVDIRDTASRGVIRLTSTGKVGKKTRTIRVNLARRQFTDYVYFSDLEVNDPYNQTKYVDSTDADREARGANCQRYRWVNAARAVAGDPQRQVRANSPSCATIAWTSTDVVRGKFHTNDLPDVDGGVFTDTAGAGCGPGWNCPNYSRNYYGSGGTLPFGMAATGVLAIPSSNVAIKAQAQGLNPGCVYTGPTRIILKGATYDVYSPNSKDTHGDTCGTMSGGKSLNLPIPANGVIYVQSVPTAVGDANYSSSVPCTRPWLPAPRPANSAPTYLPDRSTPAVTKPVPDGFPLVEDKFAYGCRNGDAFVEGHLSGRLTIATENDSIITGDIIADDRSTDLLGIVAQNSLWNYHPVNETNAKANFKTEDEEKGRTPVIRRGEKYDMCTGGCMANVRIDAALMSVMHGYGTQYPDVGGNYGTIHLYGSLVQKWRNNVGGGTSSKATASIGNSGHQGYAKDYQYDPKLRYTQPPSFLSPVTTQWAPVNWSEVSS